MAARQRRPPHARPARPDGYIVAFVGRIQPLKAPDVLVRAAAELRGAGSAPGRRADRRDLRRTQRQRAGPADALIELARSLGIADPGPVPTTAGRRRPASAVPGRRPGRGARHNESFGLVALEAQACGTPVVAAAVGGLVTAVRDGVSRCTGARSRARRLGTCDRQAAGRAAAAGGVGQGCPRARSAFLLGPHGARSACHLRRGDRRARIQSGRIIESRRRRATVRSHRVARAAE